jgi:hypothetical protein
MSPDYDVDQTLFASIRGEGVIRSTDAGGSWSPVNAGLEFVGVWLDAPDGSNFRRDVHLALSPNFAKDNTLFAGSAAASGLYISTNKGDTWELLRLLPGQASVPVIAIAVSPQFATDETIVVSIKGHGLFRSVDRGQSFTPIGRDLRQGHASIEHLVYSKDYASDKTIVGASDEHMFVSRDGGESWSHVSRPVRYEDLRTTVVRFTGEWSRSNGEQYSALTESSSESLLASASLHFFGTGVEWLGSTGPDHGVADVFIDGELVETVDTRSPTPANMRVLFSVEGLDFGAHTFELVIVERNPAGEKGLVSIDAFDVLSQGQAIH